MKVKGIPQTGGASLKTVAIFWNNTKLHRDQIGRKYVAFDVETTGLYPRRGDRIIEIGAVSIQDGITASEFHSLVNVPRRISKLAQRVHGITNDDIQDAPMPEQVFSELQDFICRCTLVAHNAGFDMSFLRYEFQKNHLILNNKSICTLERSRRLFPGLNNYKLHTVYRHVLKKEISRRCHRALDDARMVAEVWMAMEGE